MQCHVSTFCMLRLLAALSLLFGGYSLSYPGWWSGVMTWDKTLIRPVTGLGGTLSAPRQELGQTLYRTSERTRGIPLHEYPRVGPVIGLVTGLVCTPPPQWAWAQILRYPSNGKEPEPMHPLEFLLYSALWINVPGLTALVTVCSLCGMVIYAHYKDCDPIKNKDIEESDQVRQILLLLKSFEH